MKTKPVLFLFIMFLFIPLKIFPQATLHFGKTAIGYQYGYNRGISTEINSSSVIFSFFDIDLSYTNGRVHNLSNDYEINSFYLSYTFIKPLKRIFPAVSIAYHESPNDNVRNSVQIGLSLAGEILISEYLKIFPEAGVVLSSYLHKTNNINEENIGELKNNAAMYIALNMAGYLTDFLVVNLSPGYQFQSTDPVFILSTGAAFYF